VPIAHAQFTCKCKLHIPCAKKANKQKMQNFLQKVKGFRDGLSKKKTKKGNSITQPQSHSIPKIYILKWDETEDG